MSHAIRIKRRATSTVPDDILTNERLSWPARVVLGWMLGRSADFKLHVWHVRKTFRLSEKKWVSLRRNLQQEGYYWQGKERGLNGRFVWKNIVSDQAEFPPPPINGGMGNHPPKKHGMENHWMVTVGIYQR